MSEGHYVYILRCSDGSYYVGSTENLEERIAAHSAGNGPSYTAGRRPLALVHSELHNTKSLAVRRERQLKKWTRAKKEALIAGETNKLRELSKTGS